MDRRTKSGGPAPHPKHKRPPPGATANKPRGGTANYVRGAAKRNGETNRGGTDGYVRGAAKRATASEPRGAADGYVGGQPSASGPVRVVAGRGR
ncbi:hypothetical protein HEK616_74520 [Streptomyces nigrescens]|uniref:Uncharacterized protein n=1 Tax=Streptomyces nigrescens TaxID=1920 RepID=A0ABN6R8P6_STRNI|nr:hypothetical protein HEK616_74520 [Streptomyces nigrescens]